MSSCCKGAEMDDPGAEQNVELEKQLLKERLENLFMFKILLLGAGESGKSTIVKQIKLIHSKKNTKQELNIIADSLNQNVIDCMKALLYACQKFDYKLDDQYDNKTAETIMEFDEGERIGYELGEDITRLFNSKAVKSAYKRRSEFWLLDSCGYYMQNLDRFTEIGFTPTDEDAVMARIRTTGIVVSELEQKIAAPKEGEPDTLKIQVVDVGGQRNERKKWIHCFDDVKAILFIVNLAGYNQVLFEDASKNRMMESLDLFRDITHRANFIDTPVFLFLNKKDLFEVLSGEVDLSNLFPDYTGGKDVHKALEFIESKFRERLPGKKEIQVHVVTGVWKRDIKCAFEEVKKKLYDTNRKDIDAEMIAIKKLEKKMEKKSKWYQRKKKH